MSRKFNTKKFIKDVLNDRYAHPKTAIQSVAEVLLWPFFDAVKEMAGSSHTPACCLSKLKSSIEAGKKQPRVWLQYVCGVEEMLLYSSYSGPLVFLWSPISDSEMARNGFLDEPSGKAEREDGLNRYASDNICSCVIKAGFVTSHTCVHGLMTLCRKKGIVVKSIPTGR